MCLGAARQARPRCFASGRELAAAEVPAQADMSRSTCRISPFAVGTRRRAATGSGPHRRWRIMPAAAGICGAARRAGTGRVGEPGEQQREGRQISGRCHSVRSRALLRHDLSPAARRWDVPRAAPARRGASANRRDNLPRADRPSLSSTCRLGRLELQSGTAPTGRCEPLRLLADDGSRQGQVASAARVRATAAGAVSNKAACGAEGFPRSGISSIKRVSQNPAQPL